MTPTPSREQEAVAWRWDAEIAVSGQNITDHPAVAEVWRRSGFGTVTPLYSKSAILAAVRERVDALKNPVEGGPFPQRMRATGFNEGIAAVLAALDGMERDNG